MRFRRHQEAAQASTRQLLVAFAVVLLIVVLAANGVLALIYRLTFPFTDGFPPLFFGTNTAVVLLFVLGGCWFETLRLQEGGPHVARLAGARELHASGHGPGERQERRFANIVTEMALASRMTTAPQAWVLPRDDAINAFAAGWRDEDAVVVVSRGALERLTREELQGVVAHEFSHLANGDTRLHMRLLGLVWGLEMVYTFGRSLAAPDEHGQRSFGVLFGLGLMAVGSLGWAGGRLLQAAVSRQREFLADASAVQYTRNVEGLGGALRKIGHQAKHRADKLRSPQASALAHFYLHTPGRHLDGWWATHPPLAERLRRLYGETVELLPDDPQPPPGRDEALPFVALAPSAAASVSASAEAERHDALQNPAWASARQHEVDALARFALRHGPGELRASLLAGLVANDEGWARWSEATRGLAVAGAIRADVQALSTPVRLATLRELAQRLPAGHRSALRSDARKLTGKNSLERLRRAGLLAALHRKPRASMQLDALRAEAAAATALLAGCFAVGCGTADSATWAAKVWQALDCQPPPTMRLFASRRLRHLSPMQRPQLARLWVEAVEPLLWQHAAVVETLLLACTLLETPLPPALADQARSL